MGISVGMAILAVPDERQPNPLRAEEMAEGARFELAVRRNRVPWKSPNTSASTSSRSTPLLSSASAAASFFLAAALVGPADRLMRRPPYLKVT